VTGWYGRYSFRKGVLLVIYQLLIEMPTGNHEFGGSEELLIGRERGVGPTEAPRQFCLYCDAVGCCEVVSVNRARDLERGKRRESFRWDDRVVLSTPRFEGWCHGASSKVQRRLSSPE